MTYAVVTVASRSHLHQARALAASLREVAPAAPVFVCLVDRPPAVMLHDAPFRYFFADSLGIAEWPRFAFQYSSLELACALKPWAIKHVLAEADIDKVVYLDSDVQVYAPFIELDRNLDCHPIVLTPHLTTPLSQDGGGPGEVAILRSGVTNAGFVAVRRSAAALAFLAWWQARLSSECVVDIGAGLHVDQRWLDLVPGLFPNVLVERHPGYNVAYWNLAGRRIEREPDGRLVVNGQPLSFFHFSGFLVEDGEQLSKHTKQPPGWQTTVVGELARAYGERLRAAGAEAAQALGYTYDVLADGTPIKREWREAMRLRHPHVDGFADPFAKGVESQLVPRLTALEGEMAGARADWRLERASVLAVEVQRLRAEREGWEVRYGNLRSHLPVRIMLGFERRLRRLLGRAPSHVSARPRRPNHS